MAAVTYQCTHCGSSLKSPEALPAGKKIRCPKCKEVFAIDGAATAPAPKAASVSKAKPTPSVDDDEDAGVSYLFKQEEVVIAPTDAELSGGKKKRDDDEDDDDGDDDRPAKKKKKGFKKKKQASSGGSGKTVLLVLGGIFLLLLLAGGGTGAYLYLNWYKNKGTGKEVPLALLPADCKIFAYVNLGSISNQPAAAPLVEQFMKGASTDDMLQRIKTEAGVDPKDLMDQVYFGINPPDGAKGGKPVTNVLFMSKVPFDQNKMRLAFKDATPERFKWKTYFKVKDSKGERLIYMASDHLILFTDAPEATLQAVIEANHSQASLAPEIMALIQTMESEEAWGVMPIDESARQQMKASPDLGPGMKMPAGVEAGMEKAKAMGFGAKLSGGQIKMLASVDCADDAAAKHLAEGFSSMWDKQKGMMGLAAAALGKSGSTILKDLTQSLHFASKGTFAQTTAQVSLEPVKEVFMDLYKAGLEQQRAVPAAGGRPAAGGAVRGGKGKGAKGGP